MHSLLRAPAHVGRPHAALAAIALLVLAALVGAAVSIRAEAALLVVGPTVAVLLFMSPTARLAFVVVAGVAVLGPPELNALKLGYFGGMVICLLAAFITVNKHSRTMPREVGNLLRISVTGVALIGLIGAYRVASGTDLTSVLRDLIPYLLFVMAPVFAVDAGLRLTLSRLQAVAAIALTIGSLGFLVSWSMQRGILSSAYAASVLASGSMTVGLLVFAAASMTVRRASHRLLWGLVAGVALSSAIVSGTRSFILGLPAVLLAVSMAEQRVASRLPRALLVTAGIVVATSLVVAVLSISGFDLGLVAARWSMLVTAITDPSADQSLLGRLAQTEAAQRLFLSSPIFGLASGLGTAYAASGAQYASDTPIAMLAGVGVVGATAVTLVTLGWTRLVRRGEGTEMWPRAAMIGMLIAAVTFALILPVVQDKGLSFAFILLGAPVVRTLVEREPRSRRQEPVLP